MSYYSQYFNSYIRSDNTSIMSTTLENTRVNVKIKKFRNLVKN
jgi:hypothetical protein